jgi:hypothetical protein
LWAVRGPGSAGAGCGAHDSSGRRWLPRTPAPAIWVVLVITDGEGAPPPGDPVVQAVHSRAESTVAAAAHTALNSTGPTVTPSSSGSAAASATQYDSL